MNNNFYIKCMLSAASLICFSNDANSMQGSSDDTYVSRSSAPASEITNNLIAVEPHLTTASDHAPLRAPLSAEEENALKEVKERVASGDISTQYAVNKAFYLAAENGHHAIVELLTQPAGIPLPDQYGVNVAFKYAANNGHQNIMEYLLLRPAGITLPDQDGVNDAFRRAAENGHHAIVEYLLLQPAGIPLPDQYGVNMAFRSAAWGGHLAIVEYLLTQRMGIPLPDQYGVNIAFRSAANNGHHAIVKLLTQRQQAEREQQQAEVVLMRNHDDLSRLSINTKPHLTREELRAHKAAAFVQLHAAKKRRYNSP